MEILFATLFFSLILAATFIYMFVTQHAGKGRKGFEQQALLPLQEDLTDQTTVKPQARTHNRNTHSG